MVVIHTFYFMLCQSSLLSTVISFVYKDKWFDGTMSVKPGLHIVVRVAEHACDDASKRILKPSTYRLQIFLVRDQYLRSLLPHGDQAIAGQLEKHVLKPMLAILTTYMESRLYKFSVWKIFEREFFYSLFTLN